MKSRLLLLAVSTALLALIQVGGWAQEKYVPKPNEEIYGTWVNEKSVNFNHIQKAINTLDGWTEYFNVSDSVPLDKRKKEIDRKWTDSDGNIWYRIFGTAISGSYKMKYKELDRLSKSGAVLESVFTEAYPDFDSAEYPTKIDPKDTTYRIFYRAE